MKLDDSDSIGTVLDFHKHIIDAAQKQKYHGFYKLRNTYSNTTDEYTYSSLIFPVRIEYKLKNGKTIRRYYKTNYGAKKIDKINLLTKKIDEKALYTIPKSDLYDIQLLDKDNQYIDSYQKGERKFDDIMIDQIYDALKEDIAKNGWFDYTSDVKLYEVILSFDNYNVYNLSVYIPQSYENTINILKSLEEKSADQILG